MLSILQQYLQTHNYWLVSFNSRAFLLAGAIADGTIHSMFSVSMTPEAFKGTYNWVGFDLAFAISMMD